MQQDRKGFLETRIAKWNQVVSSKDKFGRKAEKLKVRVVEFSQKKDRLEIDLK